MMHLFSGWQWLRWGARWVGVALVAGALVAPPAMAQAPGGADQLGGQLAANGTTVSFRVFSQNATRLEVVLYRQSYGAAPVARYAMSRLPGTAVWQVLVPVTTLRNLGFDIDPLNAGKLFTNIFYGYRAWGPNWPYVSSWVPGSEAGFVADVDTAGNRFNPNKLLLDPYALEVTHDYLSAAVTPQQTDGAVYASGPDSVGWWAMFITMVGDGTAYCSFMPHAFVLDWNERVARLANVLSEAGVKAGDAVVATLAYRLVTYWLPMPVGLGAWALHKHRIARDGPAPPLEAGLGET